MNSFKSLNNPIFGIAFLVLAVLALIFGFPKYRTIGMAHAIENGESAEISDRSEYLKSS